MITAGVYADGFQIYQSMTATGQTRGVNRGRDGSGRQARTLRLGRAVLRGLDNRSGRVVRLPSGVLLHVRAFWH